jgi:hypothetical protein
MTRPAAQLDALSLAARVLRVAGDSRTREGFEHHARGGDVREVLAQIAEALKDAPPAK